MDLTSALGISYVEFVQRFAQQMELERFSHDCVAAPSAFSVFVDGDEFTFIDDRLWQIELMFPRSFNCLGPDYQLQGSIESQLSWFANTGQTWSIVSKYCLEHWIVFKVNDLVQFEYEFDGKTFVLQYIRIGGEPLEHNT